MLGGIDIRLFTIVFAKPSQSAGNKLGESLSSDFAKPSLGSEDTLLIILCYFVSSSDKQTNIQRNRIRTLSSILKLFSNQIIHVTSFLFTNQRKYQVGRAILMFHH